MAPATEEDDMAEEEEEADMAAMLDLTKKKKKKKKVKAAATDTESTELSKSDNLSEQQRMLAEQDLAQEREDQFDRKAEYTYEELLDRVVNLLHANNPDLVEKKRRNIKPPQLTLLSSKKTLWINFQEICSMMQRPPEHVYQFFYGRTWNGRKY
ncbi:hypothetical protein MHU86_8232 [Fragilaria crotonensis]|nr:hypothetical protein MHU86_8232 [Fragilaria crotonensis]